MAIIKCPACGGEVSDQAAECVHCGADLAKPAAGEDEMAAGEEAVEQVEQPVCPECGNAVPADAGVCPSCGFPVEREGSDAHPSGAAGAGEMAEPEVSGGLAGERAPEQRKVKGRTILVVIAVAVVAIAAVAIGFAVNAHQEQVRQEQEAAAAREAAEKAAQDEKAAYNQYIDTLEQAMMIMLSGAADAESLGNTARKVWNSAIWDHSADEWDEEIRQYYSDDFNDALSKLYADPDTVQKVSEIKANQDKATELYKKLQNPPSGLEGAFSAYEDMYDEYVKLTRLATGPSGSLQSYSSDFREADEGCLETYEKLQARIPEKKK